MLSIATFGLWLDVGRAVLYKIFITGPFVHMLILMFRDVGIFLILSLTAAAGFSFALFFNGLISPQSLTHSEDCPFDPGDIWSYGRTLVEDFLGLGGVGDQISCAKTNNDYLSTILLEMYLVVSAILLLNMLIAMMGATFSVVADNQKEEYMNLNSRIVIAADMDLVTRRRHSPSFGCRTCSTRRS